MQYFGSNIVEGVAESWVEAEMSWVEVDGAGWRWVHGLVIHNHNKKRHEIHNARRIIVELKTCLRQRHLPEVKLACSVRMNICRIKAANLVILRKCSITDI